MGRPRLLFTYTPRFKTAIHVSQNGIGLGAPSITFLAVPEAHNKACR